MSSKVRIGSIVVVTSVLLGAGLAFLLLRGHPLSMSCARAMDAGQAKALWAGNQDVVRGLEERYSPSSGVSVWLDTQACAGKAFLHVDYDTAATRDFIQQVIEGTPLKPLPVEWQNI